MQLIICWLDHSKTTTLSFNAKVSLLSFYLAAVWFEVDFRCGTKILFFSVSSLYVSIKAFDNHFLESF